MSSESGAEIRGLTLMLDGEGLHAESNSPRDVSYVLGSVGRKAIVHSIEANFAHVLDQNPGATISRPSVHVISLGNDRRTVLTPFGQHNRIALSRSVIELQPSYREYWDAVLAHNYTPEVRRFTFSRSSESIALLLRNPETDPTPITPLEHLPRALGFLEPACTPEYRVQLAEALARDDREAYRALWQQLENENEAAVDRQVQSFDAGVLPPAQIGRTIAMANMRASLRGNDYLLHDEGYLADLSDAEEGAYQYGLDEVSELLKSEIARVKSLRTQP